MSSHLSPARLKSARSAYYVFNILNSFSFVLLSGSFITLFALRLGASNSFVGLLNAFGYVTFFFLPFGKRLVRSFPIVKVFGYAWAGRYLAMIPVLFAPIFAAWGKPGVSFGLIIAGTAGFSIFRGTALIGNNPVLALLGGEGSHGNADRGAFLMNISITNSLAGMAASLFVAVILGRSPQIWVYVLSMALGILTGLVGVGLLLKTPEPEDYRPENSGNLLSTTIEAFRDQSFKLFIVIFLVLSFVGGMARSFLPVYAKDVFSQGDDAVMLFSLAGSLGSVAMGLLTRRIVDRLGSKPLFVIFTALSLAGLLPVALLPGDRLATMPAPLVLAILAFINFAVSFSFAGEESAGQNYYFSLVPKEKTLDLSVVYYFAYGLGGSIGAGAGGIVLDAFESLGIGIADTYRLFYSALGVVLIFSLFRMGKLKRFGSASVRESLGVMLSIRDLRAFDLLSRLDQSADPEQEVRLIHEIGASATKSTQTELAQYLASPRLEVRMESLLALENMPSLDLPLVEALIREVERHPYTTAYVAARVLGRHRAASALPCLRKAIRAEDYMLQGSAMISLAWLGDSASRKGIEDLLEATPNPRVKISAAYALELLGDRDSLPALVSCLRKDDPPAFVSDEIVLACASLLGIMNGFYPMYKVFSENAEAGIGMLMEAVEEGKLDAKLADRYKAALGRLFEGADPDSAPISALVLGSEREPEEAIVLSEAILDPALSYAGFRFLVASYPLLTTGSLREDRSDVSGGRG
jgi:hypothetical protein